MSDYISRQAAIEALKTDASFVMFDDHGNYTADGLRILEVLTALPSVQPEPRWIPCERELPAVGRSVLISVGGIYTAEGCLRDDGDWTQFRWDAIQRKDMVGAWKPLEEPYKGEQE